MTICFGTLSIVFVYCQQQSNCSSRVKKNTSLITSQFLDSELSQYKYTNNLVSQKSSEAFSYFIPSGLYESCT